MTDQLPKVSAVPMLGLQAMNVAGAYSYGDRVADAIAQIVAWIMAVQCQCAPPGNVISATHYLCVVFVMAIAIVIQHKFIKNL
jgi:hypothetical protein